MQTFHYFDLRVVTGICFSLSTVCCFILETSIAIDDLLPVVTIMRDNLFDDLLPVITTIRDNLYSKVKAVGCHL